MPRANASGKARAGAKQPGAKPEQVAVSSHRSLLTLDLVVDHVVDTRVQTAVCDLRIAATGYILDRDGGPGLPNKEEVCCSQFPSIRDSLRELAASLEAAVASSDCADVISQLFQCMLNDGIAVDAILALEKAWSNTMARLADSGVSEPDVCVLVGNPGAREPEIHVLLSTIHYFIELSLSCSDPHIAHQLAEQIATHKLHSVLGKILTVAVSNFKHGQLCRLHRLTVVEGSILACCIVFSSLHHFVTLAFPARPTGGRLAAARLQEGCLDTCKIVMSIWLGFGGEALHPNFLAAYFPGCEYGYAVLAVASGTGLEQLPGLCAARASWQVCNFRGNNLFLWCANVSQFPVACMHVPSISEPPLR